MHKRKPKPPFQDYREWKDDVASSGIYKSYVNTHHVSLHSNKYRAVSPKTDNQIAPLFSGGEYHTFLMLDWNDNVSKIYAQYPLDLEVTYPLSKSLKIKHPRYGRHLVIMTTDLVAKLHQEVNGAKLWAIQVKYKREKLKNREKEKIRLEQAYWQSFGALFTVIYAEDLPKILIDNLVQLATYRRQKYSASYLDRAMAVYNELRSKCEPDMLWSECEQCSSYTQEQLDLSCHELLLCLTATKKIAFPIASKSFSSSRLADFSPLSEEVV